MSPSSYHNIRRCHNSVDLDLNLHCRESLKTRKSKLIHPSTMFEEMVLQLIFHTKHNTSTLFAVRISWEFSVKPSILIISWIVLGRGTLTLLLHSQLP
jgi:hypothetical protein